MNQIALIFSGNIYIIPTSQIALRIKQFYLGNLSCGISIIHFVLSCTWLLMLRYQFVIALITHLATYGDDVCLVACSLFGIIAQIVEVVKGFYSFQLLQL